jgi:multidrug efflux pump subunit AcrA (membrane-fusion protein)
MKKTVRIILVLTVILTFALTACANQAATPQPADQGAVTPEGIVAEGNLKPIHAVHLSFQARGTVEAINVQIGDPVKKGDLLARLSNFDVAMAQLTAANLELNQAQLAYDQLIRTEGLDRASAWTAYMNAQITRAAVEREWEDLNVDDIEDRIEDAKADLEDLKSDVQDAKDEFDKYKDLDKDNTKRKTAEDDLEIAQENYNEALRDLDEIGRERDTLRAALDSALGAEAEARYQFELGVDGVNREKLAVLSARLDNAKAQVAAAEDALGNYQITAPFNGVVAEVNVEVGEQVGVETRAVSLIDASSWIIETTDITELEVVGIAVDQPVTFTADALPDVTMQGVVTEISAASIVQGGDVIYTVRIAAEAVDPRVRWGMTVEVIFEPAQ